MSDIVSVLQRMQNLDVSPQFQPYSRVVIHVDADTDIVEGNTSGRTLEIDNPFGTVEMAQNILSQLSGYQYQPYEATNAQLDPAAEMGDAANMTGAYGGIYRREKNFGTLMAADIAAPCDEEIDHEYNYESPQQRQYNRTTADLRASLTITNNAITAEVLRATQAEGTLSSQITQTATEIAANVVKKTGGSTSTFGWSLTDSSWSVSANGTEVFKINSSGATVKGIITATGGTIGGFSITSSSIYNGMSSINSTANGVYIGTNGIAVGGGKFKVTSGGAVSAANMTLTGTLNIGGTNITAAALRQGAQSAYTNGGTWSTGAGYGTAYHNATIQNGGSYPSFYRASYLYCNTLRTDAIITQGITYNTAWRYLKGGDGNYYYFLCAR